MTASTYPKIKSLSLKLVTEIMFSFSINFGYIAQHEASLVLMLKSIFIYNIHHSQLSGKSTIVLFHSPLWFKLKINILNGIKI